MYAPKKATECDLTILPLLDPRLKTTSMCLSVSYGSRHDPEGHGGLAHLLEHLLMSAPVGDGPSLCERVVRLGGYANAETGLEQMLFFAQVHADDTDALADVLCRAVLTPQLTFDALDSERDVVLQELIGAEADAKDVVQDAILAALFAGHPLGRPVGGTQTEVRAIGLRDLIDHYTTEFLSKPMTLVVVGPRMPTLDTGSYRGAVVPWRAHRPVELGSVVEQSPSWPAEYAWVCLGARSPARDAPSRPAYDLLAALLDANAASLLYRRLRNEHGLAYDFYTWDRGYTESGAWRVLVGVEPGNGDRVIDVVRTALAEIAQSGPTDVDLEVARRRAEVGLMRDSDSPFELAQLVGAHANGGTTWSPERDLAALQAVSASAVAEAADDVLRNLVTVVRPKGRIR
ncbi:M16 family metallopeptidase [Nonomuraea sp. NPDC051941]|uniref:M16 family metallopeptidase n=1 Tax=Nonomuraea sp. NPDC051941 TaxID=3364373 RepID=UPI0037C6943D